MENTTKRIADSALEGKKPIAAGYKIFDWDWSARGDYCYADENGNVEGSIHTINGGCDIRYCLACEGVSRCILCHGLEGARLMIFNKAVTEARYNEVNNSIMSLANGWHPDFTNAQELKAKSGGEWKSTPAHLIAGRTAKEAYADMPAALRAYIQSLPEYDDEIFKAITELK